MRTIVVLVAASALVLVFGTAGAMDDSSQRYAQMLASGGVSSVQRAAEEIYNQAISDQELLDVAAEVLVQNYNKNTTGETFVDSMAWVCRALGNSGNGRYKALLTDVSDKAGARKVQKHCKKGAGNLPKGVEPYAVGSISLDKYKSGGSGASTSTSTSAPAKSAAASTAPAPSRNVDFSKIREGMTMEEVESLIGPPTAMNSRMTGKAFRPFNFSGKDSVRSYALYKGVGRLVLSNSSAYTSTYRVIEIVNDPTETGYP
jgi:hypothetical protein